MKNLIIYYSRRGQNYVNGSIKHLDRGNAELITEFIKNAVGADVFEVDTVKPYDTDYMVCIEEAKAELRAKARPELKEYLDDISEYDNIFVVGPNWWGIYPMAMYTQLERLDFTGKTVHYIVTHEGSGLGGVPKTIKNACKGAKIGESLAVHGGSAPSSKEQVENWAEKCI
ncbi:flavodoxin [Ruminococcus sp. JE7B6]|uniref:flavodoxin n=1 Tax=Ruminococcus sp. JE7B6 TaxID=3233380 RepID=UPI002EB486D4|nr:flavodoxin [Ruminococcus sp.]